MYTPVIKYGFYKDGDKVKYKKMPKKKKKVKAKKNGQV